jgi:hypothetical protein
MENVRGFSQENQGGTEWVEHLLFEDIIVAAIAIQYGASKGLLRNDEKRAA